MGAHALRDGALSNLRVIDLVNEHLVPVWVNIREEEWPRAAAIEDNDWELWVGAGRRVLNPYAYFYFVRSCVLTPDGDVLLNDDAGRFGQVGHEATSYKEMLERSLALFEQQYAHRWRPALAVRGEVDPPAAEPPADDAPPACEEACESG